ncbi:hypothetical protein MAHJHV63_50900 [Mycobacterium avium subsp. hominissuis]
MLARRAPAAATHDAELDVGTGRAADLGAGGDDVQFSIVGRGAPPPPREHGYG